MKHFFYTALATLVVASGVALTIQPSFSQTISGATAGSTAGATGATTGTGGGHHKWQNNGQSGSGNQGQTGGQHNGACERILAECRKVGFIKGQWKEDNGLYRDCFDPLVKGTGTTTRDGKPISVPVSQADVSACRAAKGQHGEHGGHNKGAGAGTSTMGSTGAASTTGK